MPKLKKRKKEKHRMFQKSSLSHGYKGEVEIILYVGQSLTVKPGTKEKPARLQLKRFQSREVRRSTGQLGVATLTRTPANEAESESTYM